MTSKAHRIPLRSVKTATYQWASHCVSKRKLSMLHSHMKWIRSSPRNSPQGRQYHQHVPQRHRLQTHNRSHKRLWQAAHGPRHRSGAAPSKRPKTLCYSVTAAGSASSGREGGGATTQVPPVTANTATHALCAYLQQSSTPFTWFCRSWTVDGFCSDMYRVFSQRLWRTLCDMLHLM